MTIFKPALFGIATLLTLGTHTISAQATALRTFLSSTGNDANTASNCSATTPCRTLAAAFSVTDANGHIFMTDVAGYGSLTITRSVTLVAIDGALIGVPAAGAGITINAGANDIVTIEGLIIDGANVGANGIIFNTGRVLTVKNSVIRGMTQNGILFQPNGFSTLQVSNTVVTARNVGTGVNIFPTGSNSVSASLSRVELQNNLTGLIVNGNASTGTITAVVADSVVTENSTGLTVNASTAASRLMVIRTVVAYNNAGVSAAGATATLRLGQSTLTGNFNSTWTAVASATVRSYADNNIDGNGDAPEPTPTAIGKK